ncbi:MAG: sugar ABC transporter substrate-binding protein [Lachnospiraceae bacterium]|nr:sugar ABC transporter substrate-binding protein [Lachnospiraceae bacterium]
MMKKMKRAVSIMLMAAIMVMMVGCSSDNSQNEKSASDDSKQSDVSNSSEASNVTDGNSEPLVMVYPADPGAEEKLNTILAEFNKEYPDIQVKVEYIPFTNWGDYITKVKTMISGNQSIDVIRLATEGVSTFVEEGLAISFNDFFADNEELLKNIGADQVHENVNSTFEQDGKKYGLAWEWNNAVEFINTKLLEEANLSMPEKDWSREDILQYAQALTVEKDGYTQYGIAVSPDYFTMSNWIYANNGSILNEDMTECTLNTPEVKEVVQFLYDLVYKYKVAPVPAGLDNLHLFMSDQIAMISYGRGGINSLHSNDFTTYDVQYIPGQPSGKIAFGAAGFVALSSSKQQENAMLLASWLAGNKSSQETFMKYDSIPSRIDVMEELLPSMEPENGEIWRESADNAVPLQAPSCYAEMTNIFDKYMTKIFADEISVEEGLEKATEEINKLL